MQPEVGRRFPDGIVQICRAIADRAVKLGGDEARLPFHEGRIVSPDLEEALLVGLVEREHIHQHHWAGVDAKLTFDGKVGVQRAKMRHGGLRSMWYYDVNVVL
ncbi:hypothetical protein TM239_27660 [Bradyrhizobium sp. TM239]|nr:hypothetical protein TM239_27660 [Bradyrhizobium sp. TM239]